MNYDVVIIGAGICGCSLAYELSKYKLSVLVLEKENDVCTGTTKANSGIVHAGYDPETGTLMAKFNLLGSRLIEKLCKELSVEYIKTGSLVVGFSEEDKETLNKLYERGLANGVPDISVISGDEARKIEPALSGEITSALWAKSAAIVSPWGLGLGLCQVAVKNGVSLSLDCKIDKIEKSEIGFTIETKDGILKTRFVVNAAGIFADKIRELSDTPLQKRFSITPSKGEYYLLDHSERDLVKHVIFQCPNKNGKGVLIAPTVHGNIIVGPSSDVCLPEDTSTTASGLDFVKKMSVKAVPTIQFKENIRNFAGVRANSDQSDFVFGEDDDLKGFFNMAGIKSPGLSSAPAMAVELTALLNKSGLELTPKESFDGKRELVRFKELSDMDRAALIEKNPLYGRVICRCETVTEGEIMDALHSPIPPVSIDGVKRRCASGMGRCQGGFCSPRIHELLANHYNIPMSEVLQDLNGSQILVK